MEFTNEQDMKKHILELVKEYCETYHNKQKNLRKATEFPMLPAFMTVKKC